MIDAGAIDKNPCFFLTLSLASSKVFHLPPLSISGIFVLPPERWTRLRYRRECKNTRGELQTVIGKRHVADAIAVKSHNK